MSAFITAVVFIILSNIVALFLQFAAVMDRILLKAPTSLNKQTSTVKPVILAALNFGA